MLIVYSSFGIYSFVVKLPITIRSIQNVVEVGSQLLESNNRPLWEQLTEVTMATHAL